MRKQDEFDSEFAPDGEAIGYISLDQAVLQALTLAQQDEDRYRRRLGWNEIVWKETASERREDSYRVLLQFKRPARGLREEQTGEEEFRFDLLGKLAFRQVVAWPEPDVEHIRLVDPPPPPPITPRQIALHRFWTELLAKANAKTDLHAKKPPSDRQWASTRAGIAGVTLDYLIRRHDASVELGIYPGSFGFPG